MYSLVNEVVGDIGEAEEEARRVNKAEGSDHVGVPAGELQRGDGRATRACMREGQVRDEWLATGGKNRYGAHKQVDVVPYESSHHTIVLRTRPQGCQFLAVRCLAGSRPLP